MHKKDLRHAPIEGYGAFFRDQVKDRFGNCGGRVETINNGEIREEEVHG